jgi:hypothetical protein
LNLDVYVPLYDNTVIDEAQPNPVTSTSSKQKLPRQYWELFVYYLLTNISGLAIYYCSLDIINEVWLGGKDEPKAQEINDEIKIVNQFIHITMGLVIGYFAGICRIVRAFGNIAVVNFIIGVLLLSNFFTPYLPLATLQLSETIILIHVWVKLAMIVPEESLGMATGILYCNQNFITAIIPMMNNFLADLTGSYKYAFMIMSLTTYLAPFFNSEIKYQSDQDLKINLI